MKHLPDCTLGRLTIKTFCMAKLSTAHGFTKGVSVDVLYL